MGSSNIISYGIFEKGTPLTVGLIDVVGRISKTTNLGTSQKKKDVSEVHEHGGEDGRSKK